MSSPPSSVLIVGSATIDTIVQKDLRIRKIGGVVTYAGLTFRKLGIGVTVLTHIGLRDRAIATLYESSGIDLVRGETILTTRFVNHIEDGYRWQEMPRKARRIEPSKFYPMIKGFNHIHLGSLHPDDYDPEFHSYLMHSGRLVTLDLQGYIRRIQRGRVTSGVSKHLHDALIAANVVKSGARELETVLDTYKMDEEDLVERFKLSELLVTSGRGGGFILTSRKEKIEFAAKRIEKEIDSTGAGDVFFAAYLAHRFYREQSVEQALDQATAIAARQVSGEFIPFDQLKLSN